MQQERVWPPLDHFIYAGRDLEAMSAQFEADDRRDAPGRAAATPVGDAQRTRFARTATSTSSCLAVDPSQKDKLEGTMGGRIDALPSPRLFAYMLKGAGPGRAAEGAGRARHRRRPVRRVAQHARWPDAQVAACSCRTPTRSAISFRSSSTGSTRRIPQRLSKSRLHLRELVIGTRNLERLCGLCEALGASIPVETVRPGALPPADRLAQGSVTSSAEACHEHRDSRWRPRLLCRRQPTSPRAAITSALWRRDAAALQRRRRHRLDRPQATPRAAAKCRSRWPRPTSPLP